MYRCCWAEINLDIIFNASVGEMEYIKINYGKAFWLSFVGVLSQSVLQIQYCRCCMCANKTYFYQCLLNLIIFKVENLAVIQVNGRRNVDFIVMSAAETTLFFPSFSVTVVDTKNKMADASSSSSPSPPTK